MLTSTTNVDRPTTRLRLWRRTLMAVALAAGLLAPTLAFAQSEVVEYYATDAIGSIRVVFDAAGNATARSDYLPFGEAFGTSGSLPAKRFTGQERDGEAGLDNFNARSLIVRHARFGRTDPIGGSTGDPQSWNRYAYAANNPLVLVDPTGMYNTPSTMCTQSTGAYYCPGQTGPANVDDYFNPDKYGYHGGDTDGGDVDGVRADHARLSPGQGGVLPDAVRAAKTQVDAQIQGQKIAAEFLINVALSLVDLSFGSTVQEPGAGEANKPLNPMTAADKTAVGVAVVAGAFGFGSAVYRGVIGGAAESSSVYVLGRQVDTAVAKDWPGHSILEIPDWSVAKNDAYVQQIINQRGTVYLASPQTPANMFDIVNNRATVFAREVGQLLEAGYSRFGDILIPPGK